jgi:hypothetical protein
MAGGNALFFNQVWKNGKMNSEGYLCEIPRIV